MKKICERCGKEADLLPWETKCYKCMKIEALEAVQEAIRAAEPGEEIDTYSSDYVICPYCGEATDASDWCSYDYEIYEDGDHECECDECGNIFVLTTDVILSIILDTILKIFFELKQNKSQAAIFNEE